MPSVPRSRSTKALASSHPGATRAADREAQRLALQAELDAEKSQAERNRLGQFATPTPLAIEIATHGASLLPARTAVDFLDPALGTGAFYSALRQVFPPSQIRSALGFEIDPHYGQPAARLWADSGLTLRLQDFSSAQPQPQHNFILCNPPYVRHHHLSRADKVRLAQQTYAASGMGLSGLSGLYAYFVGLAHAWLAEGGIAGWLIPSEFMDVNYGDELKRYLLSTVTLLHIHRFDPHEVQFGDALVSSAVVWLRKAPPPPGHRVRFSFGGSLRQPQLCRDIAVSELADQRKWTRLPAALSSSPAGLPMLKDFFTIRRGLATGDNDFFIVSGEDLQARNLPRDLFTPILPSPRYLVGDEIAADAQGLPRLERRRFLLNTRLAEDELARRYPTLAAMLQAGRERGLHQRYLCRHRSPWYAQEQRPPAPLYCTYLGRGDGERGRPFRFILNHSQATVANVYLAMYPRPVLQAALLADPGLLRRIWQDLNQIPAQVLLENGRVYGGGLHKLEPRELGQVPLPALAALRPAPFVEPLGEQASDP